MKNKIRQIRLFLTTVIDIIKFCYILSFKFNSQFIHYHLGYGWDYKDLDIIWQELHKAHKIYAKKLNKKYKKKLYNPGKDRKKV